MLDYGLNDDEQAVVDAARQLANGPDPWGALVAGGWLDLLVDDDGTGVGYLGLVAEELGYAGVALPLPGTAAVWPTRFGSSSGGRRVGVVIDELCEDGLGAELVVVADEGFDSFTVDPVASLEGDGLARVTVTGQPVARADGASRDLAMQQALALVCSEMAGAIRRIFELTLEHLRTREQFGQPLAGFQVVQHEAARLAMLTEAATAAARWASHDVGPEPAHAAKAWLSAASQEVSARSHQLHGAIGFTEEYGLQRLTKRLRVLRFAWGDDRHHHVVMGSLRGTA